MLAIYTRLSADTEESNSIEYQLREGENFAKTHNLSHKQYNDGKGISGTLDIDKRPELNNLILDIKSGKIKKVWMRNQDRLDRNSLTFFTFIDAVKKNNVDVYFGNNDKLDFNDPATLLQSGILSSMNAYQAGLQGLKTKRVLDDNIKAGKAWGVLPYGYSTDDNMIPYVNQDEELIINRIFNEYLSGKGGRTIATKLNEDNVPTRYNKYDNKTIKIRNKYTNEVTEKDTKNIIWVEKTIMAILKNRWYIGERTYSGQTYQTPKIIDEILFHKVQKTIESRKGNRTSTPKFNYLLKGLIRCEKCGRNYYGRTRKSKSDNFYLCSSKRMGKTNCGNKSINITKLESFIIKHLFNDKQLLEMMESISNDNEVLTAIESEIKTLETKLQSTNNKIIRYAKLLGEDLKDDEVILQQYKNEKKQVNIINETLLKLRTQQADLSNSQALNNYKEQLASINPKSDFNTLKTAVNNIIENIRILSAVDIDNNDIYAIIIEYKRLNEVSTFYTKQPYQNWIYGNSITIDKTKEYETIESSLKSNIIYLNEEDIYEFN